MNPQKVDSTITKLSQAAAFVLIGWFAHSRYHDDLLKDQNLHQVQTVVIPKLKAQAAQVPKLKAEAGCEHWRAQVTEKVAKQAIIGAHSDAAPIPDAKAVPPDHCDPVPRK